MKRTFVLTTAAAAFLLATPALAGDYGKDSGKHNDKNHWMQKIDLNGDGQISKDEFMTAHEEKFEKLDADGNGYVSKEEMREMRDDMKDKMKEKHHGK